MSKRKGNDILAGGATLPDMSNIATKIEVNSKVDKTDATVTKQGNTFNTANSLLQLDANGKLPVLDGRNLVNISPLVPYAVNSANVNTIGNSDLLSSFTFRNNIPWVQPIMTSATTYGNCTWSTNYAGYEGFRALDGNINTSDVNFAFADGYSTGWWNWALPFPIKISQIKFYNRQGGNTYSYRIWTDNTRTIPLSDVMVGIRSAFGCNTINLSTPIITNNIYIEILSGTNACGIGELVITATQPDIVNSKTIAFNTGDGTTFKPTVISYADYTKETNTVFPDINVPTIYGAYSIIKELGQNPVAVGTPQYGKDLYVDFTNGNANDNYGLHTPTIIGNVDFSNGKFNSNGITGLQYPITNLGTDKWCIQGKFNFTNMSNQMEFMSARNAGNWGYILRRGSDGKMQFWGSSNVSSWDICQQVSGTQVLANLTDYYIRIRFDLLKYYVDWSIDGITWTNDITISSTLKISYALPAIYFGYSYLDTGNLPLIGTMDNLQVTIGNEVCVPKQTITSGKSLPSISTEGSYHCLITTSGLYTYKFVSGSWVVKQFVPLGSYFYNNGTVSNVVTNMYNQNGNVSLDYIIESWKSIDGSTWYEKYRSGLIKQGGTYTSYANSSQNIIFPVPYVYTTFTKVQLTLNHGGAWDVWGYGLQYFGISTSGFYVYTNSSIGTNSVTWEARGY